jgi:hypothetical protein
MHYRIASQNLDYAFGQSLVISLLGHLMMFALIGALVSGRSSYGLAFIAAGPDGQATGAISVGLVRASDVPGLGGAARESLPTQLRHQTFPQGSTSEEITLEHPRRSPRSRPTEKPVAPSPRLYSSQIHSGTSPPSGNIGSLPIGWTGGIGLTLGSGAGGIAGGSDYGRRLQQALMGYYRFNTTASPAPRFVIVRVRFARSGRVLSIVNGRLDPAAFLARSGNPIIDARVEAALLELDRNPLAFPADFLPGAKEAVAEIYFQY